MVFALRLYFDENLLKLGIKKGAAISRNSFDMVARPGIEPGTQGFSVPVVGLYI